MVEQTKQPKRTMNKPCCWGQKSQRKGTYNKKTDFYFGITMMVSIEDRGRLLRNYENKEGDVP